MTQNTEALEALAAHHDAQGLFHAKAATSHAPWYHCHAADTRKAADHFAVADAIRARAQDDGKRLTPTTEQEKSYG